MTKRAGPAEAVCERVPKRGRVGERWEGGDACSASTHPTHLKGGLGHEALAPHGALALHHHHHPRLLGTSPLALLIDHIVLSISQAREFHTLYQLKGQLVVALRRVDSKLEAVNERFNLGSIVSLESSEEHQFHAPSLGMHARTISTTFRLRGRHASPGSEGQDKHGSGGANEGCVVTLEMSCESMDGNTRVECKCGTMWTLQRNKFSWSESSTRQLLQLSGLGEWEVGGEASASASAAERGNKPCDFVETLRLKWFAAEVSERMMVMVRDKYGLVEARHMAGLGLLSDDIYRLLRLD